MFELAKSTGDCDYLWDSELLFDWNGERLEMEDKGTRVEQGEAKIRNK